MTPWNFRSSLLGILLMMAAAGLIFAAFERHISAAWFALGVHPEVLQALESSLDDQKALAADNPREEATYRRRFSDLETLLRHLRVLSHNREGLVRRYQQLLLLAFLGTIALLVTLHNLRRRRLDRRLEGLRAALADLAEGRTDLELGESRRDLVGRISAMIEQTSRVMARDRRRLATLDNLSAWQEAARRHAHEMRTPLTGARLELSRLGNLLERESLEHLDDIRQAARSATQELEHLGRFAQEFTSFARLPRPEPEARNLATLVNEFVTTYEAAWANLDLELDADQGKNLDVCIDRDMLRQVLVNLCDNSSLALAEARGQVRFRLGSGPDATRLDVIDNGPGIDPTIRRRLFEPYTTTRRIGQGMGLGLAISKKILLDHGGDLELLGSSAEGTTFRLSFPPYPEPDPEEEADSATPVFPPLESLREAKA